MPFDTIDTPEIKGSAYLSPPDKEIQAEAIDLTTPDETGRRDFYAYSVLMTDQKDKDEQFFDITRREYQRVKAVVSAGRPALDNESTPDWLETPDTPASYGLVMTNRPELLGDQEQGIEMTAYEFDALKRFLFALRLQAAHAYTATRIAPKGQVARSATAAA